MAAPASIGPRNPDAGTARRVPQLSGQEFRSVSDVGKWAEDSRRLFRDLAMEMDTASVGLRKILEKEAPGFDPGERRAKARKVSRRLRVAAIASHGAAVQVTKFWAMFLTEYEPVINPRSQRKRFDWQK